MEEKVKGTCCSEKDKSKDENTENKSKVPENETPQNEEMPEPEEAQKSEETEKTEEIHGEYNDENNLETDDSKKTEKKSDKDNIIKEMSAENENLCDQNKNLCDENTKLQNEVDTLKDRLLRITAEYDNFRKRTAKEKEQIYTDACEDVLKNILPVLDNLERADEANGSIEDLKKGIDMTIKQFKDSLSKLDVEEICNSGEFDPNMHHAVMHIEDKNYKDNEIVEVFQKGYKKGSKVLRYSMVKVAN